MEELLPVGSIVALKDERLVMIIGYLPSTPLSEKQYDYIVVDYLGITKPQEELRNKKDYLYMNKSDVEKVLFIGYADNEFDFYKKINETIMSEMNRIRNEKGKLEKSDIQEIYDGLANKVKSQGSEKNEK